MIDKKINVIYIGDNFYDKSNSMMASTYKTENEKLIRFCWADIQNALDDGNSINIRPATDAEMLWAYKELARTQKITKELYNGK